MPPILLARHDQLDLALYRRIAFDREPVAIAPELLDAVARSRAAFMAQLASGASAYGVNTGLGLLAAQPVQERDQASFQRSILAGRCAGSGHPLSEPVVRGVMLLRLAGFLSGYPAVSPGLCTFISERLNDGFYPVVPGGVSGAPGEIVQLAHLFATLVGDGFAHVDGRAGTPVEDGPEHVGGRASPGASGAVPAASALDAHGAVPAASALEARGVAPYELAAKEGIALINGAPLAPALAVPLLLRGQALLEHATLCGALTIAVTGASLRAYAPRVGELTGDPGQLSVHRRLWSLLDPGLDRHLQNPQLQNTRQAPVSLRVIPQVHGAAADLLDHLHAHLERALRAVTDSPVFLPADGAEPEGLYSTGNFHAQYSVLLLDASAIALTQVVNLLEKRLHRLLDTRFSELPDQLTPDPGRQSGVVVLHKQVMGLAAEARALAAPASIHAIDGSTGQEDFQTHTLLAAHQLDGILSLLELAIAHELVALRQARFLAGTTLPAALETAISLVSELVAPVIEDRSLAEDVERCRQLVASGRLIGGVRCPGIWS